MFAEKFRLILPYACLLLFAQACTSSCQPNAVPKTADPGRISVEIRGFQIFIAAPESIDLECPLVHYVRVKDAAGAEWVPLDFKPGHGHKAHYLEDAFQLGGEAQQGCGEPGSISSGGQDLTLPRTYPKETGEKALSDSESEAFKKLYPGYEDQDVVLAPTYVSAPVKHVRIEFSYGKTAPGHFMQEFTIP